MKQSVKRVAKKEKLGYLVNFRLSLLTGFLPGMGF